MGAKLRRFGFAFGLVLGIAVVFAAGAYAEGHLMGPRYETIEVPRLVFLVALDDQGHTFPSCGYIADLIAKYPNDQRKLSDLVGGSWTSMKCER